MEIPSTEPTVIRAGDSAAWSRELPAYSADDGWALKYRLIFSSGTPATITSTGAGTLHSVALTAGATAGYTAGIGTLVAMVERGSGITLERVTLAQTPVTVLPDLSLSTAFDGRSPALVALTNLRAALAAMVADGSLTVQSVNLEGRSTTFRSVDDLRSMIAHYEREVARESALAAALNGVASGRVQVRF